MQTAVQEQVPEQQELELTPEQVEEQMFEEAAALAGLTDTVPTPEKVEDKADPAPPAEAEEAGETTPEEVPQAEAAPPDPFAEATPEQRQAWQQLLEDKARLEHDSLSNRNRVSALQKKVNDLSKEPAKPVETPSADVEPSEAELVDADTAVDLREFQEDFPIIYDAVNNIYKQQVGQMQKKFDSQVQTLNQKIQDVAQPVEHLQEKEQNTYRQHQLDALKAAHPDWQEVQSKQGFWDWVDSQTDGIKALSRSVAAADNIALLNLFKSQVPAQAQPAAEPQPSQPKRQPDVALPRVNSGGRPSQGVAPNDEDAAWDYWSENYDKL